MGHFPNHISAPLSEPWDTPYLPLHLLPGVAHQDLQGREEIFSVLHKEDLEGESRTKERKQNNILPLNIATKTQIHSL